MIHSTLHLQHHKHSGRFLSHRHTSYRSLFLVIALATIAIGSIITLDRSSLAATLDVSAKVSAVSPTQPAVIQEPANGATVTKDNFVVKGTCQPLNPTSIVAIYSGAALLGSTSCLPGGVFNLQVVLKPGVNLLIAKTVNITNDYGPDSAPVTVTYTAPREAETSTPAANVATEAQTEDSAAEQPPVTPLAVQSRDPFMKFGPNQPAIWVGSISGGSRPYHVVVDWNDGTTSTRNIGDEEVSLEHTYSSMKTYAVKVSATDTSGQAVISTFLAITPYQPQQFCDLPSAQSQPDWAHAESGQDCAKLPQVTAPVVPLGPLKGIGVFMLGGGYMAAISVYAVSWVDARVFAFRATHLGRLGGRYPRSLIQDSVRKP
ncbi:hypothetical protein EPO04_01180 [Patescibacteria group bacterium]|nr:MAG: hypothetical protein EPO04_01180 [Patescibacteria group bacterium]